MKPSPFIIFLCTLILINACTSNEIANSKDVNPETIYMFYSITYKEDEDSLDCFLQYRFGGPNGTTLVLSEPSAVKIDEHVLSVDSIDLTGAFYEKKFAAAHFTGDHFISYKDINGKILKEQFNFHHITCNSNLPSSINRNDLELTFEGVDNNDTIEINISDTASATNDIKVREKIINGKLIITSAQLKTLSGGPCSLGIFVNTELPLENSTMEGGKLVINHLIKESKIEIKD